MVRWGVICYHAAMLDALETLLKEGNPLFVLGVLLVSGFALGALAQKLKLPGMVGNIAAGILVGPHGLGLFSGERIHDFDAVTDFALCIFGFTMGTHLVLRQLHNAGHRIVSILLYETILVPTLIFTALYYGVGLDLPQSLLLAAIGLTTSPSTIIHIILHRRSKGIFTKTLITAVVSGHFPDTLLSKSKDF